MDRVGTDLDSCLRVWVLYFGCGRYWTDRYRILDMVKIGFRGGLSIEYWTMLSGVLGTTFWTEMIECLGTIFWTEVRDELDIGF